MMTILFIRGNSQALGMQAQICAFVLRPVSARCDAFIALTATVVLIVVTLSRVRTSLFAASNPFVVIAVCAEAGARMSNEEVRAAVRETLADEGKKPLSMDEKEAAKQLFEKVRHISTLPKHRLPVRNLTPRHFLAVCSPRSTTPTTTARSTTMSCGCC